MSPCLRKGRRKISIPVGKQVWLGGFVSSTTLTYGGNALFTIPRELNNDKKLKLKLLSSFD